MKQLDLLAFKRTNFSVNKLSSIHQFFKIIIMLQVHKIFQF